MNKIGKPEFFWDETEMLYLADEHGKEVLAKAEAGMLRKLAALEQWLANPMTPKPTRQELTNLLALSLGDKSKSLDN
mgnify:FL=1